ncbi:GNAT family N-acetyltransferase [Solirubrobacter phytolaccae]|uniref:GNAT family N-acetyltransferase n=1 Tax=Solirubrobacter phytolaccae TaxID=1404360 RepID=A0A9X3N697_9ACTN|nr:GNAT family N-acetyltransferase [Solirubrobacter phytolaccae]MDA0179220.1 GNAT family N-acetyltransferase [Solirubrobacter phytolaccae]
MGDGVQDFTLDDVAAVRARQLELGLPQMFEWVHETAPTLRDAIDADVIEAPLLVLDRAQWRPVDPPGGLELRLLDADDEALAAALGVEHVAFGAPGTAPGPQAITERDVYEVDAARLEYTRTRIRRGTSVTAIATGEYGPVAVGTLRPVGDVAEIVAVATLPAVRRQGLGGAVTAMLVEHALSSGIETVFLSAASDDVARVYERLGFRRTGTACFVQ